MKIDKVRDMADDELWNRIEGVKEEIFRARIQKETGQLDQMEKARSLKKDLARMKTVLRERELSAKSSTAQKSPTRKANA